MNSDLLIEEGLTGTTSNTLPSECPGECLDPDQTSAVNEGTCGIPATDDSSELRERTTPGSIGWEGCRKRAWRIRVHLSDGVNLG